MKKRAVWALFPAVAVLVLAVSARAEKAVPAGRESPGMPSVKNVLEKDHVPVIQTVASAAAGKAFSVTVQAGEVPHPMTEKHRIQWIRVFLGNEEILFVQLSGAVAEPRISFSLKLEQSGTLRAEAHCSEHGTWGGEKHILIES
jgi:superoxide reductase